MSRRNRGISKPVAIAVEGVDFLHFLRHQLVARPALATVHLYDFKENGLTLNDWLEGFRTQHNFASLKCLGIIRDAETDAVGMLESIQSSLSRHGYPVPEAPNQILIGEPTLAYLIIPHGQPKGCLEHAMLQANTKTERLACVDEFLNCVGTTNRSENWQAKFKVRALITSSDDPDRKLGETSQTGLWDWSHPSLKIMLDFIDNLVHRATE